MCTTARPEGAFPINSMNENNDRAAWLKGGATRIATIRRQRSGNPTA
jgi:hypothetical protein